MAGVVIDLLGGSVYGLAWAGVLWSLVLVDLDWTGVWLYGCYTLYHHADSTFD